MAPFIRRILLRPRRLMVVMTVLYMVLMLELVHQVRTGLADISSPQVRALNVHSQTQTFHNQTRTLYKILVKSKSRANDTEARINYTNNVQLGIQNNNRHMYVIAYNEALETPVSKSEISVNHWETLVNETEIPANNSDTLVIAEGIKKSGLNVNKSGIYVDKIETSTNKSGSTIIKSGHHINRSEKFVIFAEFINKSPNCSGVLNHTSRPAPPVGDFWQTVQAKHLYVYSAYLDRRQDNIDYIKVIIIRPVREEPKVFCQLWFDKQETPIVTESTVIKYSEQARAHYTAAAISCKFMKLPPGVTPLAVSIVKKSCDQPNNALCVHDNKATNSDGRSSVYNYTVCLGGPLKFGLNNSLQLAEWLELNSIFGADHFIMYNNSASSALAPLVEHYITDRKLVEWLPWQLPDSIENQRKMKNFGHLGLVNDCLYRSMHRSKRVVYLDTDEFIVPRYQGVTAWNGMLVKAKCVGAAFVSVQNVFFKKEWPDDVTTGGDSRVKHLDLVTQLKTKRASKIWPHGSRSKYIIKPENVDVTGIHQVWKFSGPNTLRCRLHKDAALVHHYRWWDDPNSTWVEDKWLHKYQEQLVGAVERTHSQVKLHKQYVERTLESLSSQ